MILQIRGRHLLAVGLALAPAPAAAAQDDTAIVIAGPQYAGGELKERLLGTEYRGLWTTPVRVPVLNLGTYAGGLRPHERGGGQQTKVLHMRNPENREFVFRSVDKDPSLLKEPALRGTLIGRIVRDQVSSLNPASAAVVDPLLSAAGVLHPRPMLVLMPDDPALGEFREEFGGVLGWIEERPDEIAGDEEGEDRPGFGGFTRIIGTDRLLERLEESPDDRVDAHAYLTARLLDLVVGDWDRHGDQWRWAERELEGGSVWVPIPRDRDYAMVNYDGVLLRLARRAVPNALRFAPRITGIGGLTMNARHLDRRLLAGVELPAWDSIASFLQSRLTDSVIAEAVRQMPPEYVSLEGDELAATLRGRRDDLPRAAREFYGRLSGEVDVRGTDQADLAVVERQLEDVVEVRIYPRQDNATAPETQPYFSRRFYAPETNDIRIYLDGGDDYAIVRGEVERTIMVRVIGGGGDDVLVDSSVVRINRSETAFYDARGENRFERGPETVVSTRPYEPPDSVWTLSGMGFRDWGQSRSISPVIGYRGTDGPIVGGGPVYTRRGFRKVPYASRFGARARIGLKSFNAAVEAFGDFRRTNSPWGYSFEAEATQLENFRFYGLGNATDAEGPASGYTIDLDQITARASLNYLVPDRVRIDFGPVVTYSNPDVRETGPVGELPRYGNAGFGQVGAWAAARIDGRDAASFATRGFLLDAEADAFPDVWTTAGPFGSARAAGSVYLTPGALPATLALRAGAERVWGEFPVHEAAFLGGSKTIRGYPFQRYAGDAMAFGNAELRLPLTEAVLLLRGTLGALALADAGRVWFEGASEGDWHTALGGGLWFRFQLRRAVFALSTFYAQGSDGGRPYILLGAPF